MDLVIANEEDLQAVLGIDVPHADVAGASLDLDGYRSAAERVTTEFGVAMVAVTLRESVSASDNAWSAVLLDGASGEFHHSQRYDVRLVDRIGGGDSFAAGLIYGLGTGRDPGTGAALRGGGERAQADHSRVISIGCRWTKWNDSPVATPADGSSGRSFRWEERS